MRGVYSWLSEKFKGVSVSVQNKEPSACHFKVRYRPSPISLKVSGNGHFTTRKIEYSILIGSEEMLEWYLHLHILVGVGEGGGCWGGGGGNKS